MKARIKIIALLALAASAFMSTKLPAQNIIYEVPSIESRNSIIRTVPGKDFYVIYNEFKTTRQFIYFKPGMPSVLVADFTPANVSVTDMEIVDGILYFCGYSDTIAAFGKFNIQSVFAGTGAINFSLISPYLIDSANNVYEMITNINHIEVQRLSNKEYHLYMIADAYNYLGESISNDYRCILDVWDTGGAYGTAYSQEQFTGEYYFNDLAIIYNDLVVVGDHHRSIGQKMHKYSLPSAATPTIFPPATTPIQYWYLPGNEFFPIPEMTIEHIHDSTFAVACKGIVQSATQGISLSIYGGVGNPIDRVLINNPYNTTRIRDLRYNSYSRTLSLLPDWQYTGNTDNHYVIGFSSTFNIANVVSITTSAPTITKLHSLDDNSNSFAMVSGDSMDSLYVWQSSTFSGNYCEKHSPETFSHYTVQEREESMMMDLNSWNYDYRDFFPIITTENRYIICK